MSKKDVQAYLARRGPVRAVEMGEEAQWALGLPVRSDFNPPPDWVRNLIRQKHGVTDEITKVTEEEVLIAVAQISGVGSAMAQGARLLFTETETDSEAEREFKIAVGNAMQPAIEGMETAFAKLPPNIYKGNTERFAAFAGGQAYIAKEMAAEARDEGSIDTVTDELRSFLWLFWPEAKTATSVHALFEWLMVMKVIHCSEKLLEKVCRDIGYHASKRRRKKRIPTN